MITDIPHSVNMYVRFCVERFELSHVMDIALQKYYVLLLLLFFFFREQNRVHRERCWFNGGVL